MSEQTAMSGETATHKVTCEICHTEGGHAWFCPQSRKEIVKEIEHLREENATLLEIERCAKKVELWARKLGGMRPVKFDMAVRELRSALAAREGK